MKRNLLLLLLRISCNEIIVMVVFLVFFIHSNAAAQCSEASNDLGVCDTFYAETFDCDHIYRATGGYDSVRVAFYVTHDSNTFWYGGSQWVQDSIASFVVPLKFWYIGCADSVVLPIHSNWNNTKFSPTHLLGRSIFRHLVDDHTEDTTYNRFLLWHEEGEAGDWTSVVDIDPSASYGDSGHYFISFISFGDCRRWYEGSKVLLFTLTFLVYAPQDCDTTKIYLDSTTWPPTGKLEFTRYDAKNYVPRHFLPTADTIYTGVKWIEGLGEEEGTPATFSVSQNYPNPFNPVTNFKFTLPQASHVRIEIFNILGRKVKTIVDEDLKAGVFVADWDGEDERGVEVSSGIYFYRVTAGEFSDLKKMMLLK